MSPDGTLRHIYAFRVVPKQSRQEDGEKAVNAKLRNSLADAYRAADLDAAMPIVLTVDTRTRSSMTRDSLVSLSFGTKAAASSTATDLANRLASAMDKRSKPCLFVVTVQGTPELRKTVLWTFPQDEVFQMGATNLDVLSDVFSRSSALRKAAVFEGKDNKAGFLRGRVLDFQLKASNKLVADYWMGTFLDAQPQMSAGEGSKTLGKVLRAAYDSVTDDEALDQFMTAISALRSGPRTSVSIDQIIETYLGETAADAVRSVAPNPAVRSGLFEIDRDRFMENLRFRAFDLEGDIRVIAPVESIGQQVEVSDEASGRQLTVSGRVESERLRARR